jgi:uncharacterized protein
MDIFLIVVGAICLLAGLAGAIVPVIPGVPLSYVGLLLLEFTSYRPFSLTFMLVWAGVVVVVQLLDTFLPMLTTKWSGGSKAGVWGSTIGLIFGFFVGPWGIVLGPFLGALIAEIIVGKEFVTALKSGSAAFLGFLGGTLVKLIASGLMIYYFVAALIN